MIYFQCNINFQPFENVNFCIKKLVIIILDTSEGFHKEDVKRYHNYRERSQTH